MKQTLKLHGRTHRAIGSDPIWPRDPWLFDTDNEGGWGYLQFNDTFDLDTLPDPLAVGGTWGAAFEEASGEGFLIGSTTLLLLASDGFLNLTDASGLNINSAGIVISDSGGMAETIDGSYVGDVGGGAGGPFDWQLTVGNDFNVSAANQAILAANTGPVKLSAGLKHWEFRSDGTLHGPTGGSVVMDL